MQFAAILTDDDFNQIECMDIRCRLAPHILPAPWALAITGVSPEQLTDPNLPSWFEFSHQVSDVIKRWAPATWTGYNSIAFDEEFLRQSFYQNLHSNLYRTQFDNNDRLDLMKVIYAVWDRQPDCLEWPLDDKGRNSFKLDRLAPSNGFTQHDAHDALGDVEATIHIAKIIRDRAPTVWTRCLRNRDKNEISRMLQTAQPLRLIERYGATPPRSFFGVCAGTNPKNQNSKAFLDLDLCDAAAIVDADDQVLARAVSRSPKLIRTVAINKLPNIFPLASAIDTHAATARLVASRPNFQKRVGQALAERYADREEPEHLEQKIYGGFYNPADKQVLEDFKKSDWHRRAELVGQIEDPRLRQIGMRLIFWNAPEFVSDSNKSSALAAIRDRWFSNEPNTPWTNNAAVKQQLDEIARAGALDQDRIRELREFYGDKISGI